MNEDPLIGLRVLVWGCGLGLLLWLLVTIATIDAVHSDHMACSRPELPMPRTVVIRPGAANPQAWRVAMIEINIQSGGRIQFVEVGQNYEADVYILPSSTTWVAMPCGRIESEIYAGADVNLNYWASHELMHTLGLADHIAPGMSPSYYINPGYCGEYVGVMSYCTPKSQWWGVDDDWLFYWWF